MTVGVTALGVTVGVTALGVTVGVTALGVTVGVTALGVTVLDAPPKVSSLRYEMLDARYWMLDYRLPVKE